MRKKQETDGGDELSLWFSFDSSQWQIISLSYYVIILFQQGQSGLLRNTLLIDSCFKAKEVEQSKVEKDNYAEIRNFLVKLLEEEIFTRSTWEVVAKWRYSTMKYQEVLIKYPEKVD